MTLHEKHASLTIELEFVFTQLSAIDIGVPHSTREVRVSRTSDYKIV